MNETSRPRERLAPDRLSSEPRVPTEEAVVDLAARLAALERRVDEIDPATQARRERDDLWERQADWGRQVDAAVKGRKRAGEVQFIPPAGAQRAA